MPSGASPRRHQLQRGAHVLGLRDLAFDRGPDAELFQRGLAVFAGRHGLDVAHGELAVAEQLGEVEALLDLGLDLANPPARPARCGCRAGSTAVSGLIRLLVGEIVHPVEVGRDEDVGRRALLDLLGERRARGIGNGRLLPTSASQLVDGIERVLEAGRGEHRHLFLRDSGGHARKQQSRQAAQGRGQSNPTFSARNAPSIARRQWLAKACTSSSDIYERI